MTKYVIQHSGIEGDRREIVEIWPLYTGEKFDHLGSALEEAMTVAGYDVGADPDHRPAHYAIQPAPLGVKRLPQTGEVWHNRNGALVAIMTAASVLDGGYNVVTLSRCNSARNPGHVYVVDLDGRVHRDGTHAGGDLVSFISRFDGHD